MQLSSLALTVVLTFAGAQTTAPQNEAPVIFDCLVVSIDDISVPADLPANEAGVLVSLRQELPQQDPQGRPLYRKVFEGMSVRAGDVLGKVDTRMAEKQRDVAQAQWDVAEVEAKNETSVLYARAAAMKAENDLLAAEATNRAAPGAIARMEIQGFILAHEQSKAQISQSNVELEIAQIALKVRAAQLALAQQEIDRRTITAPIDGVVEEVLLQVGEWVRPGEPVVRIVGMKRLRVTGYADAKRWQPAQLQDRDVQIQVPAADGRGVETSRGKIVFPSQIIDQGDRFVVWAEVDNVETRGFWSLRPGMNANMIIQ